MVLNTSGMNASFPNLKRIILHGTPRVFNALNQCWQGAKISAARHRRGRKNSVGPEKAGAEFLFVLSNKGPKSCLTFLFFGFSLKQVYFQQKHSNFHWFTQMFPSILYSEPLKKT
jgi:hypothetical protein